jgi:crotonobetainyl-CoA:carnitine CoA-transferase CaiB-like acyl-CoA transferase
VAISVTTEDEWRSFRAALGDPAWCEDPRFATQQSRFENRDAMYACIAEWTRDRTSQEATQALQAAGVAAGPVYSTAQLFADAQHDHRGFFIEIDHPVVGRKPIMRLPWQLAPAAGTRYWAAPTFGQHTDLVLRDILGVGEAEIASLRAEGVIA